MSRIIKNIFILIILLSLSFSQQKIDFRTAEEQAKDPNVALKKSLIFPGVGQLYNDQKIKGGPYIFERISLNLKRTFAFCNFS